MKIEMLVSVIKKEDENGNLEVHVDDVNKILDEVSEQNEEIKELSRKYNRIENKINILNAFLECKVDYADEVYKKVITNYVKERNDYVEKIYDILRQIRDDVSIWSNEIEN